MSLQPGNASQIAQQLANLAAYGASKEAPPDSVLAETVRDAYAYADYLENEFGPASGGMVIKPGSSVYATADALAESIALEGPRWGDGSEPPAAASGKPFPWVAMAGAGAAAGALFYGWRKGWLG